MTILVTTEVGMIYRKIAMTVAECEDLFDSLTDSYNRVDAALRKMGVKIVALDGGELNGKDFHEFDLISGR